jgi:hypothetical protein
MNIIVTTGDITAIKSDALLCPISPDGFWFSHTDHVIRVSAGNLFHQQIPQSNMKKHGDTYLATSEHTADHEGCFKHVLFVVDEGSPYSVTELMHRALLSAARYGMQSISVPMIRSKTSSQPKNSTLTAPESMELVDGVVRFCGDIPNFTTPHNSLNQITFVAYDDPDAYTTLTDAFANVFA